MEINLTTPTQFKVLALLIEKSEELEMSLNEYTQVDYNSNSGYIWLFSEDYMFSLGLTDFGYNRGETEVELILSCPETGKEFFSTNKTDLYEQYKEYCEAQDIECYV
jgi:hypothetical protein